MAFFSRFLRLETQRSLLSAAGTFLASQPSLAPSGTEEEAGLGTAGVAGAGKRGGRVAGEEGTREGARSCAMVSAGDLCRFRAAGAMVRDRAGVRPIRRSPGQLHRQ